MQRFNGTALHVSSTFVNGTTKRNEVDLLAAYNAVNTPDLSPNVGWVPPLSSRFTRRRPFQGW